MDMVARADAAKLMKKHSPANLGEFFECAEAEGFDDDQSGAMWRAHVRSLNDAGYRAKAGLKPLQQ